MTNTSLCRVRHNKDILYYTILYYPSVRPPVRPSIRLSVCLSIHSLYFLTEQILIMLSDLEVLFTAVTVDKDITHSYILQVTWFSKVQTNNCNRKKPGKNLKFYIDWLVWENKNPPLQYLDSWFHSFHSPSLFASITFFHGGQSLLSSCFVPYYMKIWRHFNLVILKNRYLTVL